MILRRLSQSLKAQNWTAIVIEFVLLVAGVFLGIQVANWNEERVTNMQSELFTERLREDLRVETWSRSALTAYYESVQLNARKTLSALEGKAELSNEGLIIAAYRATQFGELIRYRETYDELTSTGSMGLIRDRLLRKLATEIYNGNATGNLKNEGINSRFRIAFRMAIPVEVQDAVAKECGDRDLVIGDYSKLKSILNHDCRTGLPQNEIDQAAMVLRSDPTFIPLLRLRIADVKSQLATAGLNLSPEVRAGLLNIEAEPK
ncbi:MAG: hypothetical protein IPP82_11005 [Xanthomonadales bacterium]|nr:hypothetical protein [Xanthomonadales bacterium]